MVREDIIAGLKNAMDRGNSIERAKQSFINAGYNRQEVEEAAQFVGQGVYATASESSLSQPIKTQSLPALQSLPARAIQPAGSRGTWKIILLVVTLAALVAILALTLIFREKVMSWFS